VDVFMSPFIVPVGITFGVAFAVVGASLAKALGKKWERDSRASLPPEVNERLQRMEQALDAIAVEVERVSEGQRFTTRLLTERTSAGDAAPVRQERNSEAG